MPNPWELHELDWDWCPVAEGVYGDVGPWTWSIPLTFSALASPDGGWEPPVLPGSSARVAGNDQLPLNIAYWEPLLTITMAILGWADPAHGVDRWLRSGRATNGSAALAVMDRWWGEDAGALVAWQARGTQPAGYASVFAELPGAKKTALWRPAVNPRDEARWPSLLTGGSDPLHLGHVMGQTLTQGDPAEPGLLLFDTSEKTAHATLVLERYYGWCTTLAHVGPTLPKRRDGRRWRVDVIVRPVGWLGTYRRSDVTGRWFAGRHSIHTMGWNGPA